MKRFLRAMCLAVSMTLCFPLIFSGCGSETAGQPEVSASASTVTTAAEASAEQLAPYKVVWYLRGNGMSPDVPMIEDELAKLCEDINTTVKIIYYPWGEYKDKMSLLIGAREQFDICFTASAMGYYEYAESGAYADLTDIYEEKFQRFSKVLDPALVEAAKVNGKLYALPTNKETFGLNGFDVDKEYAEECGIDLDAIKTMKDMEEVLEIVKKKKPDIIPLFMMKNYSLRAERTWDPIGGASTSGVVFVDDDSVTVVDQYQTPEMKESYKTAEAWRKAGYINEDAATVSSETVWQQRKAFARGVLPLGPIPEYVGPSNNVIKRVVIGDRVISTSSGVNAMQAFSSTSKGIDRAIMFFDKFATDAKMINTLAFGIEGVHYRLTDTSVNPPVWDYLEGQDLNSVGYNSGGAWSIGGDWFLSYLAKTDPANRNDLVKEGNKTAKESPALGFSFDTANVVNEIAACNNVVAEYHYGLATGMLEVEKYLPVFIEKMKEAGSERIVQEKQRQINEWKARTGK